MADFDPFKEGGAVAVEEPFDPFKAGAVPVKEEFDPFKAGAIPVAQDSPTPEQVQQFAENLNTISGPGSLAWANNQFGDLSKLPSNEDPLTPENIPQVTAGKPEGALSQIRNSRVVTNLLGPTPEKQIAEAVPVRDAQGNITYQYKPQGSNADKFGALQGGIHVNPLTPDPKDSALKATGKALFNQVAGLENSLLNPFGAAAAFTGSEFPMAGRVIAGGFAADMAANVPGQLEQLSKGKTLQDRIEGGLGAVVSLLTAGTAGTHALAGTHPSLETVIRDTRAELDKAIPPSTPLTKDALQIPDQTLDGLVRTRQSVVDGMVKGKVSSEEGQPFLDHIDDILLKADKDVVRASEERVAAQLAQTPPEEGATPPVGPGGPPAEPTTAGSFAEAQKEAGITPPEPVPGEQPPVVGTTPEVPTTVSVDSPEYVKATQDLNRFQGIAEAAAKAAGATDEGVAVSDAIHGGVNTEGTRNTQGGLAARLARGEIPSNEIKAALVDAAQKAARKQLEAESTLKRGGGQVGSLDAEMESGSTVGGTQASGESTPAQEAAQTDTANAVQEQVAKLPPDIQKTAQAFLEAAKDGKPDITKLAQDLGVSRETVYNHLEKMRQHFQNLRDETKDGLYPEDRQSVAPERITPSPQSLGVVHPLPKFLNSIIDAVLGEKTGDKIRGLTARLKGAIGTLKGETFPNTTIADRQSGELAARWVSSRIAAPFVADNFTKQVLEGTEVDPRKFGTALTEDNLRSVKQGYLDAGEKEKAASVGTTIGGKSSPFKSESDYQAFLKDPAVQKAIDRHKSLWGETVEPMYKSAMSINPDEPLPSRGLQTGARINLYGVDPLAPKTGVTVSTVGQGNPLGTLRKKSPFGRAATGTGTYNTDYGDMMANTFGRQLEIANKNAFENQLVESGNALIDKPGQDLKLPDGEETKEFPLKRQTVITKDGAISLNRSIYVRKTIAGEYRRGANIDLLPIPNSVKTVGNVLNGAALAGLTDATVHATNLATVLFNHPTIGDTISNTLLSTFGRADVPAVLVKSIVKGFQDNTAQMAKLAEIGALRGGESKGSKFNPLTHLSSFVKFADQATRLVMDDTFTRMAKEGLVEDTETARREFVNQAGQYNKRAQGDIMRLARDTGIGPFATAGRNFNVLGIKNLLLDQGVKGGDLKGSAILKANALSKWIGGAVLIGSLNYLLTKDKGGGVLGRPGVKVGQIDTGKTDQNGRPLTFNAIDLLGLGRGLRATGIRGAVEAKRNGLQPSDMLEGVRRDIWNTSISPFVGPVPKFLLGTANKTLSIGVGSPHPIVAPGESQTKSDILESLREANPLVASYLDSQQPGATTADALRRQLPRFTLSPSNPPEMVEKYPEIVRRAQASQFIDDVIGRARKLEPEKRKKVLHDAVDRLSDDADKETAIKRFIQRRVWVGD